MARERKLLTLKAGAMSDSGSLQGYGAAYGNMDRGGDIIRPNSCANIAEFIKSGMLAKGHDWAALGIGTISDARQDETGLWFSADFYTDDESQKERQRVKDRLDRGKDVGLSIGYETLKATWGEENGSTVRYIEAWNCYEISTVGVPMNPTAGATGAKSFEDEYAEALAAIRLVVQRTGNLKDLREGEGRKLSTLNRSRIEALAAETEGLLPHLKALLAEEFARASEDDLAYVNAAIVKQLAMSAGI